MVDTLAKQINELSYEDKKLLYTKTFSLGVIGGDSIDEEVILISLLSLTYMKLKEKDSSITPLKILIRITGETDTKSYFYRFLESLSIYVEDLSWCHSKANSCGLTSSDEIIKKIKQLLSTWTPF